MASGGRGDGPSLEVIRGVSQCVESLFGVCMELIVAIILFIVQFRVG